MIPDQSETVDIETELKPGFNSVSDENARKLLENLQTEQTRVFQGRGDYSLEIHDFQYQGKELRFIYNPDSDNEGTIYCNDNPGPQTNIEVVSNQPGNRSVRNRKSI